MSGWEQTPVLITRPLEKGRELAVLLQANSIDSFVAPAFEIRLREGNYLLEYEALLQQSEVRLIFPSVNAVTGFFKALQSAGLNLPSQLECIAVGPATAAALKDFGTERVSCSAGANSESLLELSGLQSAELPAKDILIISAPGGRDLIEETLKARGFRVRNIYVYQRHALGLPAEIFDLIGKQPGIHSVFTSAMALEVILSEWPDVVTEKIKKGQMLVISERLRKRAITHGIQSVRVSPAADNQSICDRIVQQTGATGG